MTNELYKPNRDLAEGRAEEMQRQRSTVEHGARGELPHFYRYVVLDTVFDPSIIDANKVAYYRHVLEVSNIHLASVLPRNTIVARRVMTPGTSASTPAMFLFPFFPPSLSLPCQPGEHVWVMFENPTGTVNDLGYWMCRIVEPGFVEDVNHTHPPRGLDPSFNPGLKDQFDGTAEPKYEFRNGRGDSREDGRYTIAETATLPGDEDAYENIINQSDGGKLAVMEAVPRYRKRPGDIAFEGTNNALIVIGRDRTGAVAEYKTDPDSHAQVTDGIPAADDDKPGAGLIDLVAGRGQTDETLGKEVDSTNIDGSPRGTKELGKVTSDLAAGEGDPDLVNDRSRVLIAQRTSVDTNFELGAFNIEMGSGNIQGGDPTKKDIKDSDTGDGAIVIKSDKVRLIARSDLEIVVTSYTSRDQKGRLQEDSDDANWAVVAIKGNGDIVFRPSKKGFIKLGGDDADKGLVCSDAPVIATDGGVNGPPILTTMGGQLAGSTGGSSTGNEPALSPGLGKFANKILVK